MDKIIVTLAGITSIAGIYWFFFGRKEEGMNVTNQVTIKVEGGYQPNYIRIKKGQKTTLTFVRQDTNTCLEDLYLPDFKIKKYLPLNKEVSVELTPPTAGIFGFHCGMNMFHGRIEVV